MSKYYYLNLNIEQLQLLQELIHDEIYSITFDYNLKNPSYLEDLFVIKDKISYLILKANNN